MKLKLLNGLLLICFTINLISENRLHAQSGPKEKILNHGLVIELPRTRGVLHSVNMIEKMLVLGQWTSPEVGNKVAVGDTEVVWNSIKADENGWFSSETLGRSYIYFPFVSEQKKIMLLEGMGHDFVYVNNEQHAGNRYSYQDTWDPWGPRFDYSIIPIQLKKGQNDLLFRGSRTSRLKVKLWEINSPAIFNTKDSTLPDFIAGETIDTWGAVVVINASTESLKNYQIISKVGDNAPVVFSASTILPLTVRKVGFPLKGAAPSQPDSVMVSLQIVKNGKILDQTTVKIQIKKRLDVHSRTFLSNIDGSVQEYGINPAQTENPEQPVALILSVHGAGVKSSGQANAYNSKTWAHIIAPTNRRPYGFNWEDWGRLDALEVYNNAITNYKIDPSRIYLTGHSMGGHGTWHLGSLFPDRFGALGPSAGWLSFWSYRVRDKIENDSPMSKMLMRSVLPSQTFEMAPNYKQLGIYILHGSDDDNVLADQSRQMVAHLEKFHKDFVYFEQPGAGHWWDNSDETGSDCVDWPPMMDFFARHARPEKSRIRQIEFLVANPGISAQNNWLIVEAQKTQLGLSKVNIQFDPGIKRFIGTTENVARLALEVSSVLKEGPVTVNLDSQKIENINWNKEIGKIWLQNESNQWKVIEQPSSEQKGPHRYGTFKDAFRNRMIFVYGTKGNAQENIWALQKARYDAELFWYQGNGSIDVIPDTEFDPNSEPERNVILYGNAHTNTAWESLLKDSPVVVNRGQIKIGKKILKGDDLSCLFIRPRPNSHSASVGVVAGTGIVGMRMCNQQAYLAPGYAFPDLIVFTTKSFSDLMKSVKVAGFFGLDWSLENGELVWDE